MTMARDWLEALQLAKLALEKTPAAPAWLAQALAQAEQHAPALAAPRSGDEAVPEFFYPH